MNIKDTKQYVSYDKNTSPELTVQSAAILLISLTVIYALTHAKLHNIDDFYIHLGPL